MEDVVVVVVVVVVGGGVVVLVVVGGSVEDVGVVSFENRKSGVDSVNTRYGVNSLETRVGVDTSAETKLNVERVASGSVVVGGCSLGVAVVVGFVKVILNADVVVDFDGNDFSVVVDVSSIVVEGCTLGVSGGVGFMKVMLKIDVAGNVVFVVCCLEVILVVDCVVVLALSVAIVVVARFATSMLFTISSNLSWFSLTASFLTTNCLATDSTFFSASTTALVAAASSSVATVTAAFLATTKSLIEASVSTRAVSTCVNSSNSFALQLGVGPSSIASAIAEPLITPSIDFN